RPARPLLVRPSTSSCASPHTPQVAPLSLHDALPISLVGRPGGELRHSGLADINEAAETLGRIVEEMDRRISSLATNFRDSLVPRSEEHTSELQSRFDLVCRLLLEKKKERKRRQTEST